MPRGTVDKSTLPSSQGQSIGQYLEDGRHGQCEKGAQSSGQGARSRGDSGTSAQVPTATAKAKPRSTVFCLHDGTSYRKNLLFELQWSEVHETISHILSRVISTHPALGRVASWLVVSQSYRCQKDGEQQLSGLDQERPHGCFGVKPEALTRSRRQPTWRRGVRVFVSCVWTLGRCVHTTPSAPCDPPTGSSTASLRSDSKTPSSCKSATPCRGYRTLPLKPKLLSLKYGR